MQYSLWCVLCADALSAVVVAKRHLVWDLRSILDIFTCQTTLASLSWWHGSCHFLLLLMLLTYLIAWKYLLTYQTMEVVTLTYRVAYLLDSMEVFTYLSNHSGKLVLIAWKLSSFSFVRSKLNLQPLGKMIRSWWKGFRMAHFCMSSLHRCTSETLSRKGLLYRLVWDADIGWSRSLRRAKRKSGWLQIRSHDNHILLKTCTVLSCLSPLDSNYWHVPFVYLECHHSNYFYTALLVHRVI